MKATHEARAWRNTVANRWDCLICGKPVIFRDGKTLHATRTQRVKQFLRYI